MKYKVVKTMNVEGKILVVDHEFNTIKQLTQYVALFCSPDVTVNVNIIFIPEENERKN